MRGQLSLDVVLPALGIMLAFMILVNVMDRAMYETEEAVAHILCYLGATDAKAASKLLSGLSATPEKRSFSLGIFTVVEDLSNGSAEVLWEGGKISCE